MINLTKMFSKLKDFVKSKWTRLEAVPLSNFANVIIYNENEFIVIPDTHYGTLSKKRNGIYKIYKLSKRF